MEKLIKVVCAIFVALGTFMLIIPIAAMVHIFICWILGMVFPDTMQVIANLLSVESPWQIGIFTTVLGMAMLRRERKKGE